jgi:hypothetical protein
VSVVRQLATFHVRGEPPDPALSAPNVCVSAWNFDPLTGVIGM